VVTVRDELTNASDARKPSPSNPKIDRNKYGVANINAVGVPVPERVPLEVEAVEGVAA
jgi:hypothetical protein